MNEGEHFHESVSYPTLYPSRMAVAQPSRTTWNLEKIHLAFWPTATVNVTPLDNETVGGVDTGSLSFLMLVREGVRDNFVLVCTAVFLERMSCPFLLQGISELQITLCVRNHERYFAAFPVQILESPCLALCFSTSTITRMTRKCSALLQYRYGHCQQNVVRVGPGQWRLLFPPIKVRRCLEGSKQEFRALTLLTRSWVLYLDFSKD